MDLAVGGGSSMSWVRGPVTAGATFVATFSAPEGTDWAFGADLATADTDADGVWDLAVAAPSTAEVDPSGGGVWWLEGDWTASSP